MASTSIRIADWQKDREALSTIRRRVFIEEQSIPAALEWDSADVDCTHLLALTGDGRSVGTARITPGHQIGRMAVLPDWRNQGIGRALLEGALTFCRQAGAQEAFLHAQLSAVAFYRAAGFRTEGNVYMEAGIPHQNMRISLPPASNIG